MVGRSVRHLVLGSLVVVSTSCSGSGGQARPVRGDLADGVKTVVGTELVGSVIPVLSLAPPPALDVGVPSWFAILKLHASVPSVMRRFGDQARRLGLHPESPVTCALDSSENCTGVWRSDTERLEIETSTCPGCRTRGAVAHVRFSTTRPPSGPRPERIPTRLTARPLVPADPPLGPDVRLVAETRPDACNYLIGEVARHPERVWRHQNTAAPGIDSEWESLRASVDGLDVRQRSRGGMDYSSTATLVDGPGFPRPVLAVEGCD